MEKVKNFKEKKIGKPGYINENCWLVKTLNYTPYKRCQYCELKFRNCLFLHYQIIGLILILFLFTLFFLIEGKISELVITSVFTLTIVYGYFFNKSTDKIIQAYFAQRKSKEALEELAENLEEQVKQRTKELRKAYNEVDRLSRAKSEFISIASHQLRTPLTAIKGYISMILEGSYGKFIGRAKTPMENVYKSNERLIDLVNNLLNISRIESGKMEFEPEEAAIEGIIEGVVGDLKITAKKKKLYLKFEKPEIPLPKLLLDQDKMRQVILNLVDNAIKYTQKGGITIKLQIVNGKLQIVISDTGEGMTEEELAKIFESFSRGMVGTKLYTEGAGLGLYIARRFVEMHGGRVWAESEGEDKGSTFYIELTVKKF